MSAGVNGARPRDPGENVGRPRAGLGDAEGVRLRGMRRSRCDVAARVPLDVEGAANHATSWADRFVRHYRAIVPPDVRVR